MSLEAMEWVISNIEHEIGDGTAEKRESNPGWSAARGGMTAS